MEITLTISPETERSNATRRKPPHKNVTTVISIGVDATETFLAKHAKIERKTAGLTKRKSEYLRTRSVIGAVNTATRAAEKTHAQLAQKLVFHACHRQTTTSQSAIFANLKAVDAIRSGPAASVW